MDIRHISDEYTEIGMRLIQEREELQDIRDAKIFKTKRDAEKEVRKYKLKHIEYERVE